jgi:hypothetical protein
VTLMIRLFIVLLSLLNASVVFAACLSSNQLETLTETEANYLRQKIPPAFKHALEAKEVSVAVEAVDGEACIAKLVVKLPQAHIDEANAVLDAQPAKKIMLGAQGYELPQKTVNEATFNVDSSSLAIASPDILQTAEFGKLRASLELMYAFITQKRAEMTGGQENTTPWPSELTKQMVTSCSAKESASICSCIVEQYATKLTAHEMEYITYIRENPYALATGANDGFEIIKRNAESVCNV